ncbi:hypothetical protein GDO86_006794 [Hymenochirus boettgeri]|uniref:G-protein coupled receptors family 1 profile domain-containing protein n=1 Tax=Hymenochirus boettgeri TaxID=247094 RepID=A0A8T2JF16_9PIPI|nr:hypothetical protein GDO86_006794 [Hymenochirus boettgeri]
MENGTTVKEFYFVEVLNKAGNRVSLIVVILFIYLVGIIWNLIIFTLVCVDCHLHTTMYFLLQLLSLVDISFTTTTIPKLIDILLRGNNSISFVHCFIQLYFVTLMASADDVLLSFMVYDRYVAICKPLQYHIIMNRKKSLLFLIGTYLPCCINALFVTILASKLSFCHSNKIDHFFCDVKAMAKISCSDSKFQTMIYIESMVFGLIPLSIILASYIKITTIIFHIKSFSGRSKTFSTCTSHLLVLVLFYGTILCRYCQPQSEHSSVLDSMFSFLFVGVTPMLNPLVYSLRNKEVKNAMFRLFSPKSK